MSLKFWSSKGDGTEVNWAFGSLLSIDLLGMYVQDSQVGL